MTGPLESLLTSFSGRRAAVLGVGDVLRGDDAAGPLLIKKLRGRTSALLFDGGNMPENQLAPISRSSPDVLFLADAAEWGGTPGELRLIEEAEIANHAVGTHAIPLPMLLGFLNERCPARTVFIGIQPKHKDLMKPMSREVRAGVERLAAILAGSFPKDQASSG